MSLQNPTLEHYTRYKASELKCTVLALEDLQMNTNGCSLNAIREKYRQQKVTFIFTENKLKLKLTMHFRHFQYICTLFL